MSIAKKPVAKSNEIKSTTPVRNTAIPKMPAARIDVTHDMIARRAYEIFKSGKGGSQTDNWLRAERELRNQ